LIEKERRESEEDQGKQQGRRRKRSLRSGRKLFSVHPHFFHLAVTANKDRPVLDLYGNT
jgi:hypothetical protein